MSFIVLKRFLFTLLMLPFLALTPLAAQTSMVTVEELQKIAPKAKVEFLQAIVDMAPEFEEAGINTRMRMAHFIAQVMTETGGLARLDENMNYSYKTLLRVFSRKTVSDAKAREIAGKPIEVANWVYGARLGNLGRHTMDGWNYRGSGYMQLTGRFNFNARGGEVGIDIEGNPELAREAKTGLLVAIAYWKARNFNDAADDNDMHRVRVLVNGPAAHGEDQARIWFNRAWTRVFRDKTADGFESGFETAEVDEAALFDDILAESGLITSDELGAESGAEDARAAALKEFQAELGLPESGVLDEATQEALLDPREWRHEDESADEAMAAPLTGPTEETTVFDFAGSDTTEIAPNEGTGATADNSNLETGALEALEGARSAYAAYELIGAGPVDPETFVPFSVIGEDTRVAVTDTTTFPARAIVQILFETSTGRKQVCTGAMIAPDTVLTAGHCIHSGSVAGTVHTKFQVIPGRNQGAAPFGQCAVRRAYVLSGWTGATTPAEARNADLGALKLDCKVGERTGWMGVNAAADATSGQAITIQGYATDKAPTGRQWKSEDVIRLLWDLKGFHQADTFGGTSGAPVALSASQNVIIGIHTNGLHDVAPWAENNAFTRITAARLSIIKSWIAG
jgi:predicted chitinase/V8-like Glu-specific endopeptidase